jgi:hypothetical protein
MSPRAERAIKTNVNWVDLSRRSLSYETRLLKYAARGFRIGVVGLSTDEVRYSFCFVYLFIVCLLLKLMGNNRGQPGEGRVNMRVGDGGGILTVAVAHLQCVCVLCVD